MKPTSSNENETNKKKEQTDKDIDEKKKNQKQSLPEINSDYSKSVNNKNNRSIKDKYLIHEQLKELGQIWDKLGVKYEYRNGFENNLANIPESEQKNFILQEKNNMTQLIDSLTELKIETRNRDHNISLLKQYNNSLDNPSNDETTNNNILNEVVNVIKLLRNNAINIVRKMINLNKIIGKYASLGKIDLQKIIEEFSYNPTYLNKMKTDLLFLQNSAISRHIEMNNSEVDPFLSNCATNQNDNNNGKITVPISDEFVNVIKELKYLLIRESILNDRRNENELNKNFNKRYNNMLKNKSNLAISRSMKKELQYLDNLFVNKKVTALKSIYDKNNTSYNRLNMNKRNINSFNGLNNFRIVRNKSNNFNDILHDSMNYQKKKIKIEREEPLKENQFTNNLNQLRTEYVNPNDPNFKKNQMLEEANKNNVLKEVEMKKLKERIIAEQKKRIDSERNNDILQYRIKELTEKNDKLQRNIKKKEIEYENRIMQMERKKNSGDKEKQYIERIKYLEQKLKKEETLRKSKEKEVEDMKKKLKSAGIKYEGSSDMQKIEEENQKLKSENNKLKEEKAKLEKNYNNLQESIKKIESKYNTLKEKMNSGDNNYNPSENEKDEENEENNMEEDKNNDNLEQEEDEEKADDHNSEEQKQDDLEEDKISENNNNNLEDKQDNEENNEENNEKNNEENNEENNDDDNNKEEHENNDNQDENLEDNLDYNLDDDVDENLEYKVDFYKGNIADLVKSISDLIPFDKIPDCLKRAFYIKELIYTEDFYFKGVFPKIIISTEAGNENNIKGLCSLYYESGEKNLLRLSTIYATGSCEKQMINMIVFIKNNMKFDSFKVYVLQDRKGDKYVQNQRIEEIFEQKLGFTIDGDIELTELQQKFTIFLYKDNFDDEGEKKDKSNMNFQIDTMTIITVNNKDNTSLLGNLISANKGSISFKCYYNKFLNPNPVYYLLSENKTINNQYTQAEKQSEVQEIIELKDRWNVKADIGWNAKEEDNKEITELNFDISDSLYKQIEDYYNTKNIKCLCDIYKSESPIDLENISCILLDNIYYIRISTKNFKVVKETKTDSLFYSITSYDNSLLLYISIANNKLKQLLMDNTKNIYEKFLEFKPSRQEPLDTGLETKTIYDVPNLTTDLETKNIYIPSFCFNTHLSTHCFKDITRNVTITNSETKDSMYLTSVDEYLNIAFKPDNNIDNSFKVEPAEDNQNNIIIKDSFIIGLFDNGSFDKVSLYQILYVDKECFLTKENYTPKNK